jgi:Ni,Fe-hydrogenase maturation factor
MHDTNITTAIEFGKMLGLKLPDDITIVGIEAKDVESFGNELTEDVKKAVPVAVKKVMQEIIGKRGLCSEKCFENTTIKVLSIGGMS